MKKLVEKYEMSYIRRMGNYKTHETENELIVLLPVGCYWAKKTGGCAYCGYQALVDEMVSTTEPMRYVEILRHELNKQTETIDRLSFFVGGSFFEIPREERLELFRELKKYPSIHEVYIETRPQLITPDNIDELKKCLEGKKLSVAIDLETYSDEIRNNIHKKGITNEDFIKGMKILNEAGVSSLIYVFVKPPVENITDKEAIDEALQTIKFCFENHAEAIELECGYIVENSDMHELYNQGKYDVLSLWSIRDLILEALSISNEGIIRLAHFTDTPKPIAIPSNCEKCSDKFYKMLDRYRETLDSKYLEEVIECDCRKES